MSCRSSRRPATFQTLRLIVLIAAGWGAISLSGCGTGGAAPVGSHAEANKQGYVVAVTHGPDDPDRVMLALTLASRLPRGDNHVWFAIDGGPLCKKGEADKVTSPLFTPQGNAGRLVRQIQSQGTAVHI